MCVHVYVYNGTDKNIPNNVMLFYVVYMCITYHSNYTVDLYVRIDGFHENV